MPEVKPFADQRKYTSVFRGLIENNDLAFQSRGVMLYLLTRPEIDIASDDPFGARAIGCDLSDLAELEKAGYLTYSQQSDMNDYAVTIHEEPVSVAERTQAIDLTEGL